MKIDLPFLLLFAVVSCTTLCISQAAESSSNGNSNQNEANPGQIDLSMDVTADLDEQDSSRAESRPSETSYATFQSSSSQRAVPEFGMRNQPVAKPAVSQSEQESGDFGSYEPSISAAYKNLETSSSQVVQREFVPSVYRLSDPARKPLFEAYNNEPSAQESSDQQYGQAQSLPANELDSPYYAKSNNEANSGFSNGESTDSGFTPISMSVDEAFRKYFPVRKDQETDQAEPVGEIGGGGYAQQQPQQPQEQPQGQTSGTKYLTTYTETAEQQPQAQAPPSPSREVFSIDSLREIVEKEPLARPDPFDPPSPPLSSFLPPGENAQAQQVQQPQLQQIQQLQQLQQLHQPQIQQQLQQQSVVSSSIIPQFNQQSLGQPQGQNIAYSPPQTNYVYAKVQEVSEPVQMQQSPAGSAPMQVQSQPLLPPSQAAGEEDQPEESEDEGLAYNTENLDDDGKKVSYIYSRPVRLPDMTRTKLVDASGAPYKPEIQEHVHYRKPVSYENEEDSVDHPEESLVVKQAPGAYEDSEQAKGPIGSEPAQFQGPPMVSLNQPISISAYSDGGAYKQPPQHQWSAPSDNRPDFDSNKGGDSSRPQNIEYGGFVPIKNQNGPNLPSNFPIPAPPQQQNNEPFIERPPQKAPYDLPPQGNFPSQLGFQEQRGPQFQQGPGNFGPLQGEPNQLQGGPRENFNQPPPPQQQQGGHKFGPNFLSKLPHMRFRPLYGRDAMKKLRELGISEDEFYGTVNKILKNSNGGPRPGGNGGPIYKGQMPFIPKANLYRSPPKNGHRHGMFDNVNKMRPLNNNIGEEFEFNYLKDGLPPGASYNPRDVGLDDNVLAQIHMQDSGIGGYRFPTMIPTGALNLPPKAYRPNRPGFGFKKAPKQLEAPSFQGSNQVPHAMNSIAMPFVLAGPRPFGPRRVPYSSTGKGFRSQYGYRAAASELKPQFALPKPKPFKILGQPVALTSSNVSPLLGSSAFDESGALGNILGIRSIKGIKSLVSYLTGGVSG